MSRGLLTPSHNNDNDCVDSDNSVGDNDGIDGGDGDNGIDSNDDNNIMLVDL